MTYSEVDKMSLVLSSELTIPGQTLTPTQQNVENATKLDQQVVPNEWGVGVRGRGGGGGR